MNCTDFERTIQQLLDERQDVLPNDLQEHAVRCPNCDAYWQSQQTVIAATRLWKESAAPAGIMHAVLSALTAPHIGEMAKPGVREVVAARPRLSPGSAWAVLCSTAALMLLTVTMLQLAPPAERPASDVAATSGDDLSSEKLVSRTLSGLWQGVHSEYQELSQETTRVLDELADLPDSAALLPSLPATGTSSTGTSSSESPSVEPSPSWMRITRPVSDRVGQAFDFLRDAVPGDLRQAS